MSDLPSLSIGTPVDRLVESLQAWDTLPSPSPPQADRRGWSDGDQVTLERAKGAVMLRYGVNSHVAFAVLARWSRTIDVPIMTLAGRLVDGTVRHREPLFDRTTLDDWLEERLGDDG